MPKEIQKVQFTYSQMKREERRQKKLKLIKLRKALVKLRKITPEQAKMYEKRRRDKHIEEIVGKFAVEGRIHLR